MNSLMLAAAALFVATGAQAQTTKTFAGPTASNIDGGSFQNYDFTVNDTGLIDTLGFSITTSGSYADDVTFSLSHLGTTVTFYNGHGDTFNSQIDALFTDSSTNAATYKGSAIGTFAPANAFSAFKGLAAGGLYTLSTIDYVVPGDGTGLAASSLQLTTGAVPEPATWAMMILGMGAVGFSMRSAKRRSDRKFDAKIKRITDGAFA